ncbi:unnamed protein product [Parnassius apollo]|uniref:(apollo) hypothetical protein n=1 Tax=Parnassius apollo TaxID=110799 RepID=A0A8S3XTG9_PARAO|nr:unnamed protein product [Parnassius apollo]
MRHYSDDIPDVSLSEIRMALQHLKNGRAPGEDGITAELLKAGGTPVLEVLQKLLNSVLHGGTTLACVPSSVGDQSEEGFLSKCQS